MDFTPPPIESPCILICEIDMASGLCKGCARSREEIVTWTRMSPVKRAFIMTELKGRKVG